MQAAAFSTAAASAASAASTLSTTQSTTHPYLHPKPRIGMTSTTKLHYDMTEQRFTPDDMQPHAVIYTHVDTVTYRQTENAHSSVNQMLT